MDEFEAAFANLTDPKSTVVLPPSTPDPAPEPIASEPVTEPVTEDVSSEPAEPVTEPVTEDVSSEPAEPVSEPASDPIDTKLAQLAELLKQQPAIQAPQAAPTPKTEPQSTEIYTLEERTQLAGFAKEWPDIAKAVQLTQRELARDIVQYIFDQLGPRISTIDTTLGSVARHTQLSQLQAAVPDYSDIRDKVINWVEKQPAGPIRDAYVHIVKAGSPDEVLTLIDHYRQTIRLPQTTPAVTSNPKVPQKTAAKLAPVGSKRTSVNAGLDPQDFTSAFDQFAKL